jgi:hypothetical protein
VLVDNYSRLCILLMHHGQTFFGGKWSRMIILLEGSHGRGLLYDPCGEGSVRLNGPPPGDNCKCGRLV